LDIQELDSNTELIDHAEILKARCAKNTEKGKIVDVDEISERSNVSTTPGLAESFLESGSLWINRSGGPIDDTRQDRTGKDQAPVFP
jgi:hypothetical protein